MPSKLNINENFICRIWEAGEKYHSALFTAENEPVEVIDYGSRNYDSGPDYRNAKIKIGGRIYTDDIEVHRDFKGWENHNHHKDRKYNSVILQVVLWDANSGIKPKLRIKRELPTIILSDYLRYSIHDIWQEIINNPTNNTKLPCYEYAANFSEESISTAFNKLSSERLKLKSSRIRDNLKLLQKEIYGNISADDQFIKKRVLWEQTLYELIFEALGYSKNKEPMLKVARNLKLGIIKNILKKSTDYDQLVIQALLFGYGGFLFDLRLSNEYIEAIKRIWKTMSEIVKTEPVYKTEWHFFRMRPQNFPTVRLAYGSQLILRIIKEDLLKQIISLFKEERTPVRKCYACLYNYLSPLEDVYWSYNYNFGKSLKKTQNLAGRQRINDIIINVIIPFIYYYSLVFKDKNIQNNILEFYSSFKITSQNSVLYLIQTQLLRGKDIVINTPAKEQAAIQLYNFYCTRNRCGECHLGKDAVKDKGFEYKIIFY